MNYEYLENINEEELLKMYESIITKGVEDGVYLSACQCWKYGRVGGGYCVTYKDPCQYGTEDGYCDYTCHQRGGILQHCHTGYSAFGYC